jgi:hypothetical protein
MRMVCMASLDTYSSHIQARIFPVEKKRVRIRLLPCFLLKNSSSAEPLTCYCLLLFPLSRLSVV